MQYSGTGALKTDFTRTGQRTRAGALQDLTNSIIRYGKNNFFDGSRQDAFDLVLGGWNLMDGGKSPFEIPIRKWWYFFVSTIIFFFCFCFCKNVGYSNFINYSSSI